MKFGGKAARKREAERAAALAKEILEKGLPKSRPEGNGVCKVCTIKNGHAGWCPRVS
jgi:hypothetical protein